MACIMLREGPNDFWHMQGWGQIGGQRSEQQVEDDMTQVNRGVVEAGIVGLTCEQLQQEV